MYMDKGLLTQVKLCELPRAKSPLRGLAVAYACRTRSTSAHDVYQQAICCETYSALLRSVTPERFHVLTAPATLQQSPSTMQHSQRCHLITATSMCWEH